MENIEQKEKEQILAIDVTASMLEIIKSKAMEDINYLTNPIRFEGEEFTMYQLRRKLGTKYIRTKLLGKIFHQSKEDLSKIEYTLKKAGMKMPNIKGVTYINPTPKTFKK